MKLWHKNVQNNMLEFRNVRGQLVIILSLSQTCRAIEHCKIYLLFVEKMNQRVHLRK